MRVRISDIPHAGLKIKERLSLEALTARMKEGRHNEIVFTAAPEVEITVYKTPGGAETKGRASTRIRQACSRCLEGLDRELAVDLNYSFQPKIIDDEMNGDEEIESEFIDDVGLIYFEGDHIELEEVIQEAFILALSLYWAPACDANDNCTLCHLSRKQFETADEAPKMTLGNLLKKAGLN